VHIVPLRSLRGCSIAAAAAAVLLVCAASPVLAACGGDCGADLATTPKTVEKYVKQRWKAIAKCGQHGSPACPTACPVPDATAVPYLLSPGCAAQIDCNLDALAATAYGGTWNDVGFCPLAPGDTCGNARAKNAGKLVSTKLKRRVTSEMDKLPKDEAKCTAKIAKVIACDPSLCTDAGDWIDGIFPVGLGKGGFQTVPFSVASAGEGVATLTFSASDADWGTLDAESVVVGVDVDGTHVGTIVVYGGAAPTPYRIMLGALGGGTHVLGLRHEKKLSPAATSPVSLLAAPSVEAIAAPDTRYDFTRFAPILLGIDTDLNPQNGVAGPVRGNAASDVPLIIYSTAVPGSGLTTYRYTMIWSNEDGGTGQYPDVLIARWGRTTDIEGILEVDVSDSGDLLEIRFRPDESGTLATFAGAFQGTHPIIRTSTANGLIADNGASTLQFAIPPLDYDDTNLPREGGMDLDLNSYIVMSKEMVREGKTEPVGNPASKKLSDLRDYLYLDYNIDVSASGQVLRGIAVVGGVTYYSDHNQSFTLALNPRFPAGIGRTAIELPPGTQLADIQQYGLQGVGTMSGTLSSADAFLEGTDYLPTAHLTFSGPLVQSGTDPFWLVTP
jgi:hypothetical protein